MTAEDELSTAAPTEEYVYAQALLILSRDLYPRKLEVIREYIQNASDAIDAFAAISDQIDDYTEPQIKISIQGRSLMIFDTGIGMDAEEVAKMRRVAYSEKKVGEEAGYKGIGRLAGIAVAEKLKISSTSYGDPNLHHFEFRAEEMRRDVSENKKKGIQEPASRVIERHTSLRDDPIDPREHYTMVEVRGISESCPELLDLEELKQYIGEVAPVDFSPEFTWGAKISQKIRQNVSDYSPKTIYLATGGERIRIYKPLSNEMTVAEPDFIEVLDQKNPNKILAYCWYATKGQEILGKIRGAGRIFSVDGEDKDSRQRFAGLVYKLFGFSIGDRTLPLRTLWSKSSPRALWFTGEIHIVDKDIQPTTDRSDFVDTPACAEFYRAGQEAISTRLNRLAQEISNSRKTFDEADDYRKDFKDLKDRLQNGKIERANLKTIERELYEKIEALKSRQKICRDKDIENLSAEVLKYGRSLQRDLDDAKSARGNKAVPDLAVELRMPGKAEKVYRIIMSALSAHYEKEPEEYYEVAEKIEKALRKHYS